jgi:hypothetical protein
MSEMGSLSHSATRLAVVIERVADALLVEDEPTPGRVESVSIVRAHGVAAPITDVAIVVIALIATAFAIAVAVLLPVLRARKRPKRNGDAQRQA